MITHKYENENNMKNRYDKMDNINGVGHAQMFNVKNIQRIIVLLLNLWQRWIFVLELEIFLYLYS